MAACLSDVGAIYLYPGEGKYSAAIWAQSSGLARATRDQHILTLEPPHHPNRRHLLTQYCALFTTHTCSLYRSDLNLFYAPGWYQSDLTGCTQVTLAFPGQHCAMLMLAEVFWGGGERLVCSAFVIRAGKITCST